MNGLVCMECDDYISSFSLFVVILYIKFVYVIAMQHLYLSHWNDDQQVLVHSNVVKKFKKYHLDAVRFIYNCYRKKLKGAVINYKDGMTIPLVIQAFLSAIFQWKTFDEPVLVLAADRDICMWHYHLRQATEDVALLTERNHNDVLNHPGVVLSSLDNLSYVHPFRTNDFAVLIVDRMDTVATKMIFKKLSGSFNIALTAGDFIEERDRKVLWSLLNWTNPGSFGKLGHFHESDQEHLKYLRDPYDDVWLRLARDSEDSPDEQEMYKKVLQTWARQNNLTFKSLPKYRRKPDAINQETINAKKIKRNEEDDQEVVRHNEEEYHDDCDEIPTAREVTLTSFKKQKSYVDDLKQSRTRKRKFIFEPNLCNVNENNGNMLKTTDVSKLKNRRYKTDVHDSCNVKDVASKLQKTSLNTDAFKSLNSSEENSNLGTKSKKPTEENILSIVTHSPTKDDAARTNDDSSRDSDDCVLLSIMDGKFTNSNDEIGTNAKKRAIDRNDSNSLLFTLYGDEAEFVEDVKIEPSQKVNCTLSKEDELLSSLFDYSQVESAEKEPAKDSKAVLKNNVCCDDDGDESSDLLEALFGDIERSCFGTK